MTRYPSPVDRLDGRGASIHNVAPLAVVKQRIHHGVVETEVRVDRVSWRAVRNGDARFHPSDRVKRSLCRSLRGAQLMEFFAVVRFDAAQNRFDVA